MADSEHLITVDGRDSDDRVLEAGVAHEAATGRPKRDAAVVICAKLWVVLALHVKLAGSELDRLLLAEHVARVLTVFVGI